MKQQGSVSLQVTSYGQVPISRGPPDLDLKRANTPGNRRTLGQSWQANGIILDEDS